MNKHTPGPWLVNARPFMHGHTVDIITHAGTVVVRDLKHCDAQAANARLIAAAPELLAALKGLYTYLAPTEVKDAGHALAIVEASLAIKKADGQNE